MSVEMDPLERLCAKHGFNVPLWSDVCAGWEKIVDEAFRKLKEAGAEKDFLAQVKEKFGCYDDATDVLTARGWKRIADVRVGDVLATLDAAGRIEYQKASSVVHERYTGEMYRISTRGVDLLVTPNHRLFVARGTLYGGGYRGNRKDFPFEFKLPGEVFGKNVRYRKGGEWIGRRRATYKVAATVRRWRSRSRVDRRPAMVLNMDAWLDFLGWFVAEGSTCAGRTEIAISCNNVDGGLERARVRAVLQRIGVKFGEYMLNRPAMVFKFSDPRLSKWLRENCGVYAQNKRAPVFIRALAPEQIKIFLGALFEGDGSKGKTYNMLTTTSKRLADDVQELLLLAGDAGREYEVKPPKRNGKIRGRYPVRTVGWLTNSQFHNTAEKVAGVKKVERWEKYDGMVHCATVPNGLLFVRRAGRAVWCGNSLRLYATTTNVAQREAIVEAELLSTKTCQDCGASGKTRSYGGWWITLCDACDEKQRKLRADKEE